MGMALLAHLAAHDFGYLSSERLLQRLGASLDSMNALERHQQHFFNWYDTQTCQPLHPRYLSTVDSGNLAGLLLTLRTGLVQLPDRPMVGAQIIDGLRDTLATLCASLADPTPLAALQRQLTVTVTDTQALLDLLRTASAQVAGQLFAVDDEARYWQASFCAQCRDWNAELVRLRLPLPPRRHRHAALQPARPDPPQPPRLGRRTPRPNRHRARHRPRPHGHPGTPEQPRRHPRANGFRPAL